MNRSFFLSFAVISFVGACHSSTSYEPCEGKATGAQCTLCAPDDANCFETQNIKTCNAAGQCGAASTSMDSGGAPPNACVLAGGSCVTIQNPSTSLAVCGADQYVAIFSSGYGCDDASENCCFSPGPDGGLPSAAKDHGVCGNEICEQDVECDGTDGGVGGCLLWRDGALNCGSMLCANGCHCGDATASRCDCP